MTILKRCWTVAVLVLLGGPLGAQTTNNPAGPATAEVAPAEKPIPPWVTAIEPTLQYYGETQLDDDGTDTLDGEDLSVVKASTRVSVSRISDRGLASVSLNYGLARYLWDRDDDLLDDGQSLGLRLFARHRFAGSDFGFVGIGSLTFAGSVDGNEMWDGRSYSGGLGASYQLFENVSVALGLMVIKSPEDDAEFWPLLFLDWAITDDLKLELRRGGALKYTFFDEFTASMGVGISSVTYRLDSPQDGHRSAVLRDFSVNVEAGLEYAPTRSFYVRGKVGYAVYHEIEIRADERQVVEATADPAPVYTLSVGLRF